MASLGYFRCMAEEKNKGGRPSKLDEFTEFDFRQVEILASYGLTDSQMAAAFSVSEVTWNAWKKKNEKFLKSLKKGKEAADEMVLRSLYHRACGFSHPEDKIFNDNGKPLIVSTIKRYPPAPTSMIFWLKNRQPEKWRDKQDLDLKLPKAIRVIYDEGPGEEKNA